MVKRILHFVSVAVHGVLFAAQQPSTALAAIDQHARPELHPYPSSVGTLPRLELGAAVIMFMPPADRPSLDWDFNATGPILWKTDGYISRPNVNQWHRDGLLRIHVLGVVSTVLRKVKHELAWQVTYSTSAPAKFGVESITLSVGNDYTGNCFGTLYQGCSFDPTNSMVRAGIGFKQICSKGNDENGSTVFALAYPGRAPMLMKWINSAGSGGMSSWLELRLPERGSQMTCD